MIFGQLKPPQGAYFQAWLEFHLQWIVENFGPQVFKDSVVESIPWNAGLDRSLDESQFRALADFMAELHEVPATDLIYDFVDEQEYYLFHARHAESVLEELDGQHEQLKEELRSQTDWMIRTGDPVVDVANWMAQLSYWDQEFEYFSFHQMERLLDLILCVCRGLGPVFAERLQLAGESFDSSRDLTTMDLGSILGAIYQVQGQTRPYWLGQLRLDARSHFKKMTQYLDSVDGFFAPQSLSDKKTIASKPQVNDLLHASRDVEPIIACEFLLDQIPPDERDSRQLLQLTFSKSADVRKSAAYALGQVIRFTKRELEPGVRDRMVALTNDANSDVRNAAVFAMRYWKLEKSDVDRLCSLLAETDEQILESVAAALSRAKSYESLVIPQICKALAFGMRRGMQGVVQMLIYALDEVTDSAEDFLVKEFAENDEDFLFAITDMLREIRIGKADTNQVSDEEAFGGEPS